MPVSYHGAVGIWKRDLMTCSKEHRKAGGIKKKASEKHEEWLDMKFVKSRFSNKYQRNGRKIILEGTNVQRTPKFQIAQISVKAICLHQTIQQK